MRKLIGVASVAAFLAIAPGALASTAGSSSTRITVNGQDNENNVVRVTYDAIGDLFTITDTAGITANTPGPCSSVDANTVTCPGGTVMTVDVNGNDGNDRVELDRLTFPVSKRGDLSGGNDDDVLLGSDGDDTLSGGGGRDEVNGFFGGDTLRGGSSTDVVSYLDRSAGVEVTVGSVSGNDGGRQDRRQSGNLLDTVSGDFEMVVGGAGPDVLRGDNSSETLVGSSGPDVLSGDRGNDTLAGLLGDDLLDGGDGNDTLRAAAGADVLIGANGDDRLGAGPGDDFLFGGFGSDVLKGKSGIDQLRAKDGTRDVKISCGPGSNRRESAKRDKRLDPRTRRC